MDIYTIFLSFFIVTSFAIFCNFLVTWLRIDLINVYIKLIIVSNDLIKLLTFWIWSRKDARGRMSCGTCLYFECVVHISAKRVHVYTYVRVFVCVRARACVAICVYGVIYYEYALFGTFQSINMNFQYHDNENFIKKLCIIQISVQRMSEWVKKKTKTTSENEMLSYSVPAGSKPCSEISSFGGINEKKEVAQEENRLLYSFTWISYARIHVTYQTFFFLK